MSSRDFQWEEKRVIALQNGDIQAFDDLFEAHGKRLYHFALGYLKSIPDAEEIVQEVFLKIWKNRKRLNSELSFKSYLFTIAYRQIAETLKKRLKAQRHLDQIAAQVLPPDYEEEERTDYQSLLELVNANIEKLPGRQREVLLMKKMAGLKIADISRELNISPKTVEYHLSAALRNLKVGLGKDSHTVLKLYGH